MVVPHWIGLVFARFIFLVPKLYNLLPTDLDRRAPILYWPLLLAAAAAAAAAAVYHSRKIDFSFSLF